MGNCQKTIVFCLLLAFFLLPDSQAKLELIPAQPVPDYEAEWQLASQDLPQDRQMRLQLDSYLYPAGTMTLGARWYNTSFRSGAFDGQFSLQKWDGQSWRQTSLPFDYQSPISVDGYGILPWTFRRCAYGLAGQILETTPGRYRLVCQDQFRNCQAQAEFVIYPMEWEKFRKIQAEKQQKEAKKQAQRLTWPWDSPKGSPIWQSKIAAISSADGHD